VYENHDTRPLWKRGKVVVAVLALGLSAGVLLGASYLGCDLSDLAEATLAGTMMASVALFEYSQGRVDEIHADRED